MCHMTTHRDSDQSNWFVSMLHVLQMHMPYWRESDGGGHYKKHSTISVLAVCVVLCTLSDNTYVAV